MALRPVKWQILCSDTTPLTDPISSAVYVYLHTCTLICDYLFRKGLPVYFLFITKYIQLFLQNAAGIHRAVKCRGVAGEKHFCPPSVVFPTNVSPHSGAWSTGPTSPPKLKNHVAV